TCGCPKRSANPAPSDRRHDLRDDVEAMVQRPFGREGDLQVVLLTRTADERVEEVQIDIKINKVFARDKPKRVIMAGRAEIRIDSGGPPDQTLGAERRAIPSLTQELILDRCLQVA